MAEKTEWRVCEFAGLTYPQYPNLRGCRLISSIVQTERRVDDCAICPVPSLVEAVRVVKTWLDLYAEPTATESERKAAFLPADQMIEAVIDALPKEDGRG